MLALFAVSSLCVPYSAAADAIVTGKMTCFEEQFDGSLAKRTLDKDDIVSFIAAVSKSDAHLYHELVFDQGSLLAVTRCDGEEVEAAHDFDVCAFSSDFSKGACSSATRDWTGHEDHGLLLCDYKYNAAKDTQSGSCTGTVVIQSVPCRIELKFGKTFRAKGPCPPDV